MEFSEIANKVESSSGQFFCSQIGNESETKVVNYEHTASSSLDVKVIEGIEFAYNHIPGLLSFYSRWGGLRLFHDTVSGDSAFYIAPPNEWKDLFTSFLPWIECLDEEEEKLLPKWINNCFVIGEIPDSGNYILLRTTEKSIGSIYLFDHDGFEFEKLADNLCQFLEVVCYPDSKLLTNMASNMSFSEGNHEVQWWIEKLRDNEGNEVSTES